MSRLESIAKAGYFATPDQVVDAVVAMIRPDMHDLSNDEIVEALTITRATAKTQVTRALAKAGARDRAQLVVLAYEGGLMTAGR